MKPLAIFLIVFCVGLALLLLAVICWNTRRAAQELARHREVAARIEAEAKKKEGK